MAARLVLLLALVGCAQSAGPAGGDVQPAKQPPQLLSFKELTSWAYVEGLEGMPESVKALSGKRVKMTGALLPIDDFEGCDFWLADPPALESHRGPKDHQMVHVVFAQPVRMDSYIDGVTVVGTFRVKSVVVDGYVIEIFRLSVESMEPIKSR